MIELKKEKLRARLLLRGVEPSEDPDFLKMVPWTRLTFVLCTGAASVATYYSCKTLLGTMAVIAVFGAMMPRHPFDYIYNSLIRRFTGTIELPPNAAPTRFACTIASIWFTAMAVLFGFGFNATAYTLGAIFVAIGTLVSTTHFCIPGMIFQLLFGNRRLILPAVTGQVST